MHWVYVLRSDDGDIYVGETTRLFRRWNEHQTGRGGVNTSSGDYNTIIGLYSVTANRSFERFLNDDNNVRVCERYWDQEVDKNDGLYIEDIITERYLTDIGQSRISVRGGSYTTEARCEKYWNSGKTCRRDRPLCHCGFPCEVKMKKDKTKIYFVCPVPDWIDGFNAPEKCNFWKEYELYRKIKEELREPPRLDIRAVFADPF